MKRSILALVIAGSMIATAGASAGQRGNGGGPKSKPAGAQAPKAHGQQTPKGQGHSAPKGPKAHGASKVHGGGAKAHTPHKNTTAKNTSAKNTSAKNTGRVATDTTLSPVQQKLQRNTNLSRKLDGRLPSGISVVDAAAGFRNLGQFVAAVNVSNNLGIPFMQMKTRMVEDGMSLGQAIQVLRPSADYRAEVRKAERDATILIDGSGL